MVRLIGFIELIVFYFGYLLKLFHQRKRGISTNQLGKGDKAKRTRIIEKSLQVTSFVIILVILVSIVLNKSFVDNQKVRGCGLLLSGLGTVLFTIAMLTMKDSWRAGIANNDKTEMITQGIYRISRNPAFLGFDLTYIGACISFGNYIIVLAAGITIGLMHLQILEEEKFLSKTFGAGYLTYRSKVARYFLFF